MPGLCRPGLLRAGAAGSRPVPRGWPGCLRRQQPDRAVQQQCRPEQGAGGCRVSGRLHHQAGRWRGRSPTLLAALPCRDQRGRPTMPALSSGGPPRTRPASCAAAVESMNSTRPAVSPGRGFRRTHRCRLIPVVGTLPGGSAMTARSAPRRTSSPRILRPAGRLAAAGGMRSTTLPPGTTWASACWIQASSGSVRGGSPPNAHLVSYTSLSRPQSWIPNGGLATATSAARSGKASASRESPVAICGPDSLSGAMPALPVMNRSLSRVILAWVLLTSCP